jgi:hypothetical protein
VLLSNTKTRSRNTTTCRRCHLVFLTLNDKTVADIKQCRKRRDNIHRLSLNTQLSLQQRRLTRRLFVNNILANKKLSTSKMNDTHILQLQLQQYYYGYCCVPSLFSMHPIIVRWMDSVATCVIRLEFFRHLMQINTNNNNNNNVPIVLYRKLVVEMIFV